MNVIILTGPPGVGKNTVTRLLAKKRERCAIVDVDEARYFAERISIATSTDLSMLKNCSSFFAICGPNV